MFRAVTPKDKREIFTGKEHATRPVYLRILKKPLRVLLFAGGPTRDYQFARTLLVRETESKRSELSIHVQNARPGGAGCPRMFKEFPATCDPNTRTILDESTTISSNIPPSIRLTKLPDERRNLGSG